MITIKRGLDIPHGILKRLPYVIGDALYELTAGKRSKLVDLVIDENNGTYYFEIDMPKWGSEEMIISHLIIKSDGVTLEMGWKNDFS